MRLVFVSYSSKDEAEVKKIVKVLADNNISYFKAPECIPPGSNYAREIPLAIKECGVFLLVVSQSSQDSVWVEKEIDCAINNRRIILPIQISSAPFSDLFSFYLNNVQIIRYYENPTAALIQLHIRLDMILNDKGSAESKKTPIISNKEPINYMPDDVDMEDDYLEYIGAKQGDVAPIDYSGDQQSDVATRDYGSNQQIEPLSRQLTPVELEIEQLRQKKEKKESQNSIKRYVAAGGNRADVFKTNNNKAYEAYNPANHADYARRNNSLSVNKIPERCQMCSGNLVEVHVGIFRCVSCGYLNKSHFQLIRDCLAENGALNAMEISDRTGVPRKTVEYFLLEEKLEIPVWSDIRIACQNCGALINTGRYCEKCKRSIAMGNNNLKKSDDVGYRFIRTNKK